MANKLPHHKIGVIVPLERARRAEGAVRYGVAPNLVQFGAVFIRSKSTGTVTHVACATLAFNVYAAHMYPTLVGYCCDHENTTSIEAWDRHYRLDDAGRLLGGYRVLESRDGDGDGVMQTLVSLTDWIAEVGGGDLEVATADVKELRLALASDDEGLSLALAAYEAQAAPPKEELDPMHKAILAGLTETYKNMSLEDIAEISGIGLALLELAAARGAD